MISSLIHQDLDLEELGGEITWVPPPVVTDNIVPWPGRNIMGAWSPICWLLVGGGGYFLILLTIPTKMDPFKMMSFTLFFFKFKIKNTFLLMQNRMSFWRFITEKPRFLPKPTIELVKSLSKPTIGDPHLAIKMNQPLEHSRG